jgi:uncharacterized sulfatase
MRARSLPALLLLISTLIGCTARPERAPTQRPNILWISAEDLSPDLGCYGDPHAITPNLDRLASQGVRFERAFSTAPVCAPSRSSIITGMYATSIGSHHMRSSAVPPAYVKCFPEYLRAAGYFCTNNAKTDYNFPPPLSAWDENGRDAHWEHRAKGQPFFAVFNFEQTHESRAMNLNAQHTRLTDVLSPAERHDPAKLTLPPYYPDTPTVRQAWARWYDCVTVMDREIQKRLDELEVEGLADNTIVVFWGDHGRGLPRGKRWLYDSGTRVPLIVRWPRKIKPASVRTDLASLIDLGPTMLAAAGVKPPSYMQGRDLFDPKQRPPEYVVGIRDRMDAVYDMIRSLRDERYRYVRNFQPEKPYAQRIAYGENSPILQEWRRLSGEGKLSGAPALFMAKSKPAEELYDTLADPHEINNLADRPEHQARLERMRKALVEWMTRTNDQGMIPELTGSPTTQPDRQRPRTDPPIANVRNGKLELQPMTPGSSAVFTTDAGRNAHWKLYLRPVPIDGTVIRYKACRIGFEDSPPQSKVIP